MATTPAFIVYEGIDGSGKSEQVLRMAAHLNKHGREVRLVADPGGTPLGELLRAMVKNKYLPMCVASELCLFTAARAQLAQQIKEYLADGKDVICDRWWWSTLLYQSRQDLALRPVIADLHNKLVGLEPTLYVYLDIDAEAAAARLAKAPQRRKDDVAGRDDRFESEGLALAKYLADGYRQLANETNLATRDGAPGCATVNASLSPDDVFEATLLCCRAHEFFLNIEAKVE